jgi:hypothetical protein
MGIRNYAKGFSECPSIDRGYFDREYPAKNTGPFVVEATPHHESGYRREELFC